MASSPDQPSRTGRGRLFTLGLLVGWLATGAALVYMIFQSGTLPGEDAARKPEDYAAMGLPVYENSLHFEQPDGYVHAVDLRTLGRSAWKNFVMSGYFRLMGFRILRHVGTADHLHVSLPARPGRFHRAARDGKPDPGGRTGLWAGLMGFSGFSGMSGSAKPRKPREPREPHPHLSPSRRRYPTWSARLRRPRS